MSEELEAKVRMDDPEAFRRRMAGQEGGSGQGVFEDNRLFDDSAETLRRRDSALRLREERDLESNHTRRSTLTYKGPRAAGDLKRREEIEVEAEAAAPLAAILAAIGLRETFRYQKRRWTWHAGACEITLDQLPLLGWFVEVEGPTERLVQRQLEDLGLADNALISTDYIHLLTERLASLGRDPARAVFDAGD